MVKAISADVKTAKAALEAELDGLEKVRGGCSSDWLHGSFVRWELLRAGGSMHVLGVTAFLQVVVSQGGEGITKHILKAGEGEPPQAGAAIKAHYTGRLLDGTVFDSSIERNSPFEFTLGKGRSTATGPPALRRPFSPP